MATQHSAARTTTTAMAEPPVLLSIPAAAHLLGVHPSFARRLVQSGKLRAVRQGRRVQVRRSDVDAYAASLPAAVS